MGAKTITLGNSLSVVMTVPYGKSLSDFRIEVTSESDLTNFAVTQNSTQLTLNNGVYNTTSGVSREQTFTFTPTVVGTYTITFSGEGIDVNMPEENNRKITLKVEEAPAGGDEPGGVIWSMKNLTITPSYQEIKRLEFANAGLSKLAPNLYLGILFREIGNEGLQFFIKKYSSTQSNGEGDRLTGTANLYNATGRREILLTATNVTEILEGNGVSFWGSPDVTIYEIYISTVPIIE